MEESRWKKSCASKKKQVRKALREWRKGKEPKIRYIEERKEWRKLCKSKEEEKREEEIEQI